MDIYHRQRNRGLTLVELLIVIGIIGVLGSISVPLALRMGPTPTRTVNTAARELFTVLKGARIYATTFNVETVVSYTLNTPVDTLTELPCPILDSVAIGRLMSRDERGRLDVAAALWEGGVPSDAPVFVPLMNSEGRFEPMRGGTGIISQECFGAGSWAHYLDTRGLTPVILFDLEALQLIWPRSVPQGTLTGDMYELYSRLALPSASESSPLLFPGHVYLPSGGMRVGGAHQRARLSVGLLPGADPNDRLTIAYDPVTDEPLIDPLTGAPQETPLTTDLTLYAAQGRVKVEP
jgi:prepilin-type N-terminal cleavage/methylation domain-containing protein